MAKHKVGGWKNEALHMPRVVATPKALTPLPGQLDLLEQLETELDRKLSGKLKPLPGLGHLPNPHETEYAK
jgi:hypothetical protein